MNHDTLTQKVIYTDFIADPTQLAVVDLTAEEVQANKQNAMDKLRGERNARLSACDYTQLPDFAGDKTAWATYRQALRDITETYAENLLDTEFPNQPEL
jgi:hypothetical protein